MESVYRYVLSVGWKIAEPLVENPIFTSLARVIIRMFPLPRPVRIMVKGRSMRAKSWDRVIAMLLWKYSLHESFESALMDQIVTANMVVVDVGANIGFYTLQFAAKVGPGGGVFAFEPDPENFSWLKKNVEENKFQNVSLIPCAVSNRVGSAELYLSKENRGDHRLYALDKTRNSITVDTVTLDHFFNANPATNVGLIKMDIQGAEFDALQGMTKTISNNPDLVIVTEFNPRFLTKIGHSPQEFLDLIRSMGFKSFLINEKEKALEDVEDDMLIRRCSTGGITSIYLKRSKIENVKVV